MGRGSRRGKWVLALLVGLGLVVVPAPASAHGPTSPVASTYLARVTTVPPGLRATVVDGDQRLWLTVTRGTGVVIVYDYRGAPYLRFSDVGVEVNENSAMYYVNQTPTLVPPANLTLRTAPRWSRITSGNETGWHDGRLHALAAVALAPGASYAGRWTIPLSVDGRRAEIAGGLWRAARPSIAWWWPIVVLVACTIAARRVHRPELDALIARLLAGAALLAIAVAAVARELHGRPTIGLSQVLMLAALGGFVAWGAYRLATGRTTYFTYFAVAVVALWQGAQLVPALLHGFVLLALPAVAVRVAAVGCLGCGIALLILPARTGGRSATTADDAQIPDDALTSDGPSAATDGPPVPTDKRRKSYA